MIRPSFVDDPPVKTYQSDAFALGALFTLGGCAHGILDNYFINWIFFFDQKIPWRLRFLPRLSPDNFGAHQLGKQLQFKAATSPELVGALASSLRHGFVVRLILDEYHVPDRWAHGKKRRMHDVLVVGATGDANSFELMGYCADGRYRRSRCSKEQLLAAYFDVEEKARGQENRFVAIKAGLQRPIEISIERIEQQLTDFIECRNSNRGATAAPPPGAVCYGLSIFDACIEHLRQLSPEIWRDKRIFSIMTEHSRIMLRRMGSLEALLGIKVDQAPFERATTLTGRLKLLSLLPEHRQNQSSFGEMIRLLQETRAASEASANVLLEAIATNRTRERLAQSASG